MRQAPVSYHSLHSRTRSAPKVIECGFAYFFYGKNNGVSDFKIQKPDFKKSGIEKVEKTQKGIISKKFIEI